MAGHLWKWMCAHGEDAPGKSLDTYSVCVRCGVWRHDYAHGGGMKSPNYPMFARAGEWWASEGECVDVIAWLREYSRRQIETENKLAANGAYKSSSEAANWRIGIEAAADELARVLGREPKP